MQNFCYNIGVGFKPNIFLLFNFSFLSALSSVVEHPPFKREAVSSSLTERICPLRLSARTPDFQSGERSSILLGGVFISRFPIFTDFNYLNFIRYSKILLLILYNVVNVYLGKKKIWHSQQASRT